MKDENENVTYRPSDVETHTIDDTRKLIDDLEFTFDKATTSSRVRGIIEGSIATLGIVAVSGLIGLAIVKRKQ